MCICAHAAVPGSSSPHYSSRVPSTRLQRQVATCVNMSNCADMFSGLLTFAEHMIGHVAVQRCIHHVAPSKLSTADPRSATASIAIGRPVLDAPPVTSR